MYVSGGIMQFSQNAEHHLADVARPPRSDEVAALGSRKRAEEACWINVLKCNILKCVCSISRAAAQLRKPLEV
jgi:hypothetical protein